MMIDIKGSCSQYVLMVHPSYIGIKSIHQSVCKFTVYDHLGKIVKRQEIAKIDMERPALEHAYRLLDKHNRNGLGAMVGVTGAGIHKVVFKNQGDVEPSEMAFDDMDIVVDQVG